MGVTRCNDSCCMARNGNTAEGSVQLYPDITKGFRLHRPSALRAIFNFLNVTNLQLFTTECVPCSSITRNIFTEIFAVSKMTSKSALVCLLNLYLLGIYVVISKNDLKIEVTQKSKNCIGRAQNGDYLSIHYTGRLSSGVIFATSRPNQDPQVPYYPGPYRFTLGKRQVIQGYEIGMQGMCVGEHRRFTMPPHLGKNCCCIFYRNASE